MVSLGSGDALAVILCCLGWPSVAEERTRSKQTKVERTLGARVNVRGYCQDVAYCALTGGATRWNAPLALVFT